MPASGYRVIPLLLDVPGLPHFLVRSTFPANDAHSRPPQHTLPHSQTGHCDTRSLNQASSIRISTWIQTVSFLMERRTLCLRPLAPRRPKSNAWRALLSFLLSDAPWHGACS